MTNDAEINVCLAVRVKRLFVLQEVEVWTEAAAGETTYQGKVLTE